METFEATGRRGSEDAFHLLYRRYRDRLFLHPRPLTRDDAASEDLVHSSGKRTRFREDDLIAVPGSSKVTDPKAARGILGRGIEDRDDFKRARPKSEQF
jgi:hypothetical protein